ncbi:hypothetical protein DFJ43DRAFT_1104205 [Lentinula guzmanii]|uniref:Uncharacterized protein n=1 Tax=Lentinula guzmanii TaxID=2804957 RepID=A0AA38J825_9AGAR|nr:hypothetical protein DFJ43DRAFT_1104205 [Lentinula guzmanii]
MLNIFTAIIVAITLLAVTVDASPIGSKRLPTRQDGLLFTRESSNAPSSGSGHDPAEIINTAVGAAAATSKALAVTGALPKIKDATHKGVQKVKTTLNNVEDKAHTAKTKVQLGGEELRNKLSFHKHEDGVNTDGVNTDDSTY